MNSSIDEVAGGGGGGDNERVGQGGGETGEGFSSSQLSIRNPDQREGSVSVSGFDSPLAIYKKINFKMRKVE